MVHITANGVNTSACLALASPVTHTCVGMCLLQTHFSYLQVGFHDIEI